MGFVMSGSEFLDALVLGVVQGIAEFLPISSSGHIVILSELLHQLTGRTVDPEGNLRLNVALHLGTLLSIAVVYRHELRRLLEKRRQCLAIVLATIPIVIVGFTLKDWIENNLQSPLVAGCGLLATSALLAAGHRLQKGERSLDEMPIPSAFTIGIFQAVALVPGISRSGSTISGGLITGLRRDCAATFSFFIAIPAIAGAVVLTSADILSENSPTDSLVPLLLGAAVAFVVGLYSLRMLLRLLSSQRLHWFAWYCAVAGTTTIIWQVVARG